MNKFRVLSIVWGIIVVIIFGLLIALGYIYKGKVQEYKDYEEVIINATKEYINKKHITMENGTQIIVNVDDLVKDGFIKEKDVIDSCSGKATISYKESFIIKPNIKCKYYKSKN